MNSDSTELDHNDSELQAMLRAAVRSYAQTEWPFKRLLDQEHGSFQLTRNELRSVHELGWLSIQIPERFGGSGMGAFETAVVAEELAVTGNTVLPIVTANIAARIFAAARDENFDLLLRRQAAEGALFTFGEMPRSAQGIVASDGILRGELHMVPWAESAEGLVVPLIVDGRAATAVVPMQVARVRRNPSLNAPHECSVDLTGAALSSTVCAPFDSRAMCEALHTAFAVVQMAGLMKGIASLTAEYISNRLVFGQPIARFQAARHRSTEIYSLAELTRATAYKALWDYETTGDAAPVWRAKHWANRAVDRVTQNSHLLHGGIGVSADYPLHIMTLALMALAVKSGTLADLTDRLRCMR